ncbi:Phosphopentomutase [bioreactor metagenome]
MLDELNLMNLDVVGIGKIADIYCNQGITKSIKSKSNDMGMEETIKIAKENMYNGLIFLNLVDFDSMYGHRRDPKGYKEALEKFDVQLSTLLNELNDDDLLIITADHGNDPTFEGTDHTREYVPVLVYSKKLTEPKEIDVLKSMADIGVSIVDNFNKDNKKFNFAIGESFLNKII